MLNRLDLTGVAPADLAGRLPRPVVDGDEPVDVVREIIASVRERGDDALRELADRFDGLDDDVFGEPHLAVEIACVRA